MALPGSGRLTWHALITFNDPHLPSTAGAVMIPSLPLHNWPVLSTRDPCETCSYMQSNLRPNEVWFPGRPRLNFIHNKVQLNSISLNSLSYGSEAKIQAPATENTYLTIIALEGEGVFGQGKWVNRLNPGDIYIINPLFTLDLSLSGNFKQLILQLDGDHLKHYIYRITGYQLAEPLIFEPLRKYNEASKSSFESIVQTACIELNNRNSALLDKQVATHLEEMLISLLLTEFPHNYSELLQHASRRSLPYYVRQAQNIIHENSSRAISVQELAARTGVTPRTLQKGFKELLGTTPIIYCRTIRLNLARKRLIAAAAADSTVTEIAYACGFEHLSKFSQYYKEYFGERPQETKKYRGLKSARPKR